MVTHKENLTVQKPLKDVFRYIIEFSSNAEWDPGAVEARKTMLGKVGVGTVYKLKF